MTNTELLINANLTIPENAVLHEKAMDLDTAARIARMLDMHQVDVEAWLESDGSSQALNADDEIREKLEVADDESPLVELQARGILSAYEVEEYSY